MKTEQKKHEYKAYDTARFHIPEGFYSVEDVEEILANLRRAKQITETHLARSMETIEKRKTHE